jgi:hypothetical protein
VPGQEAGLEVKEQVYQTLHCVNYLLLAHFVRFGGTLQRRASHTNDLAWLETQFAVFPSKGYFAVGLSFHYTLRSAQYAHTMLSRGVALVGRRFPVRFVAEHYVHLLPAGCRLTFHSSLFVRLALKSPHGRLAAPLKNHHMAKS